jgi:hypothetical protein
MKKLLLLLCLALSTSLVSCADDPIAPDPNAGRRATISAFYAHPDVPASALNVSVDDSITISGLGYGQFASGLAPVGGSKRIKFQGLSGTEFATTNEVNIDSGRSVWGVYSGLGTSAEDEAFAISTPNGPAVAAGLAGVRFIHASKNAGKVRVYLNVAAGSAMTDFVEYKQSNNAFTQIGINTTALVVVNEASNLVTTLDLSGLAGLVEGKRYTVILYGNADANATTNAVTTAIKLEPGQ